MYTVKVDKECGCFKRSEFANGQTFDNKDDALKEAEGMVEDMNDTFCRKHVFELQDNGQEITILMKPNG